MKTTPIILLLVSFALLYILVMPQYKNVQALRTESKEYSSVIENVEKILETRESLLGKYDSIPEEEVERLEKVLPDSLDMVKIAHELDTIAAQHGVTIKEVGLESNTKAVGIEGTNSGEPYDKAVVILTLVSSYEDFRAVLSDIEQSLRLAEVRSVSFRPSETGLYEHEIALETYWLK